VAQVGHDPHNGSRLQAIWEWIAATARLGTDEITDFEWFSDDRS
jgi:hypothetical protein